MIELPEFFILVGPICRGWVAVVRCQDPVEGGMLALMTMDLDPECNCDIKWRSFRYVNLKDTELLGWTFKPTCHKPNANG